MAEPPTTADTASAREALLAGVPVTERRLELDGVSTAVLEGGEGPPIILLHGPGESGVNWRWVIPRLVETNRVVAPDLPAHGESRVPPGWGGADRVLSWMRALIDQAVATAPTIVGHVLGGAIAARFAISDGSRLDRLVLVDTLGLAPFRPSARFALTFMSFQARPTERSYTRFMGQCAHDVDALRAEMGQDWEPFVTYNLAASRSPQAKLAGRLFREVGLPRIPAEDLEKITTPTALIWGRHDRANRVRVAEAASQRYGWPLHVIEDAADDPARDQPAAFVDALKAVLA